MPYRPDPTRRNRNAGTRKRGHGQDNRARVPRAWSDSVLSWDRGAPRTVVHRRVWGRPLPFLVERTRSDSVHACTVDDVAAVLNLLPRRHVNRYRDVPGIQGVVLRQPTRREEALTPVWARLGYGVEVGGIVGPVVFLEAQRIPTLSRFGTHLDPEDELELERLSAVADEVERSRRGWVLRFGWDGIRRVQLFHSLPHEVGHWADMYENVELPALDDFDAWMPLWDRYFQRPSREREAYAHRYAERAIAALRAAGTVPFPRRIDPELLELEGLRAEDFHPPSG